MNRAMLRNGAVLFLLGLLSGVASGVLKNPRAGLSAHLEGVMNGTFLMIIGATWAHLELGPKTLHVTGLLLTYGTFANWLATLLGAVLGTSKMTPIAGAGFGSSPPQEALTGILLVSVVLT